MSRKNRRNVRNGRRITWDGSPYNTKPGNKYLDSRQLQAILEGGATTAVGLLENNPEVIRDSQRNVITRDVEAKIHGFFYDKIPQEGTPDKETRKLAKRGLEALTKLHSQNSNSGPIIVLPSYESFALHTGAVGQNQAIPEFVNAYEFMVTTLYQALGGARVKQIELIKFDTSDDKYPDMVTFTKPKPVVFAWENAEKLAKHAESASGEGYNYIRLNVQYVDQSESLQTVNVYMHTSEPIAVITKREWDQNETHKYLDNLLTKRIEKRTVELVKEMTMPNR